MAAKEQSECRNRACSVLEFGVLRWREQGKGRQNPKTSICARFGVVGTIGMTMLNSGVARWRGDVQQTSLGSDDPISRQQIDALDTLINKSDTSSRLIPYLYANI